ncbi:MAG: arginine--tRNA ligase [Sphaerochaetaceae bacterium]|jgi:arginyl-tRNA synthetase|nr:arginine--tRNA ligase [Sphaerochaetaceae bacterium]NLY07161.1 arginine--tRNA ligase [Spirochaetales bacterium]
MLEQVREQWLDLVNDQLKEMQMEAGTGLDSIIKVGAQVPPKPEMGDIAFPLFALSKSLRKAPAAIASELMSRLEKTDGRPDGQLLVAGPYLNVKIDTSSLAQSVYESISERKDAYGQTDLYSGRKMMVEFSCPNTNKPLHLGHVRNDSIGSSISEILKANGAQVMKVNLINNRGVHICKSMLAYQRFGNGETPQSSGKKGDHLVGDYYVKFAQWEKEDPTAVEQAQKMLEKWEAGDEDTVQLWKKMNDWTLQGLEESYRTMHISFDKYYYESDTYKLGKDKILQGLADGIFYKEEDGSVWADLSDIKLDKKVLLRKDGTSLYITQDIGTAISRHDDWPFDSLTYVVASEQKYHFQVLFHLLEKLGFDWAKELHHLAYGMVFLPDGKMKSREGTVVDADDLVANLASLARQEIIEKQREDALDDIDETASSIALGAMNYYLLQVDPLRDMVFNPSESISFNGNTGPYLQYMGARICSMMRKYDEVKAQYADIPFDASLLDISAERELIKSLARYPEVVRKAGADFNPSVICAYLYDVSKVFSSYYHDNQVLKAETPQLVKARVELCSMVLQVLRNAFTLVGIPFLEKM